MRRKEANNKWVFGNHLKTQKIFIAIIIPLHSIHSNVQPTPSPYIPISKNCYRLIHFSMFFTRHVHFKIDMMETTIYHRLCNIFIVVVMIMETAVFNNLHFPCPCPPCIVQSPDKSRSHQAADRRPQKGIVGLPSFKFMCPWLAKKSDSNKAFLLFSLLNIT